MSVLVALEELSRDFGSIRAVDRVTFSVAKGEVLGFLGPNGAGKSTTMKMIAGFLAPSAGRAVVCGHDVVEAPIAAKRTLGYLPEGAPAYPDMTPLGFLGFIAAIRGFSGAERGRRIDLAVRRANLRAVLHQPIDTLSKGFKRRVGLAQALLHDPPVLIMDEPTDGLDPNQKHEVRALIAEMSADKAIVVSTHILEEVEAVCTRAIVIADGRVVADGTPAELAARDPRHQAVVLRLGRHAADGAARLIKSMTGVASVEVEQDAMTTADEATLVVRTHAGVAPPLEQVFALGRSEPWGMIDVRVERGRLDNVFRAITRKAA
jgi:ABC-2 type transport system ATP-binding protein